MCDTILGLATRTQISICKSPFPSGNAVSMSRAKRFSRHHIGEEGQNPVAGLWGRTLGKSAPEPTSSYASIDLYVNWLQVQPQRLPGCQS